MREGTPKSKHIGVRLTDEDREKLQRWADAYGLDMSTFIAQKLVTPLPETPPVIPQPPLAALE